MKRRHVAFAFVVSVFLNQSSVPAAQSVEPDARAIVKQSVENYLHDLKEGLKFSYSQKDVMQKDRATVTEISEVEPLFGTPYERLVSRDGTLTPEQKAHEDEKYRRVYNERANESPEKRAARLKKFETDRAFLKEIPDGYDFKIIDEPVVEGRPAWRIDMTPRPGYTPKNMKSGVLKHIHGVLTIDKEDLQWVKAEANVMNTISIGWVVARVNPGAKFDLEQMRVAPKLWMTKAINVDATAKVMMVHDKNLTEHLTFWDYHRAGEPPAATISKNQPKPQPIACPGCGRPPSSSLVPNE